MGSTTALWILGWAGLSWAAGNLTAELQAPRAFGYVIGDVIPLQAVIEVDAPFRLELNTLPKPGPVNRWLWLRAIQSEQTQQGQKTRYQIKLDYQTFYAPLAVKNLEIPALPLKLEGPGEPLTAQVPAWRFSTAPLRGLAAAEENGLVSPRPEIEPQPLLTWPHWLGLSAWLGVALAALAFLAYQSGWLNFGQQGRYFAQAIRALRRLETASLPPEQQKEAAYTAVHQAFNQTLGFALFSEGLPAFFADHPRYAPLQTEIEAFFAASYAAFFGDEPDTGGFSLPRLIGLCRECIRIERERNVESKACFGRSSKYPKQALIVPTLRRGNAALAALRPGTETQSVAGGIPTPERGNNHPTPQSGNDQSGEQRGQA